MTTTAITSAGVEFIFVYAIGLYMASAWLRVALLSQYALNKSFNPLVVIISLDIDLLDEIWADRSWGRYFRYLGGSLAISRCGGPTRARFRDGLGPLG